MRIGQCIFADETTFLEACQLSRPIKIREDKFGNKLAPLQLKAVPTHLGVREFSSGEYKFVISTREKLH